MDDLFTALAPQRDRDWDLEWRHPGRGVKIVRVRPTSLNRQLDHDGTVLARQQFLLRGADPRHYSKRGHTVIVPVTPSGAELLITAVVNAGNAPAYPVIKIVGATTAVSRVELVNSTADVAFDVTLPLTEDALLIGDMPARVTAAPRSVVTLDGTSKYAAWAFPRAAFRLAPGSNDLYCRTTPEGVEISVTLDYRDTWSG